MCHWVIVISALIGMTKACGKYWLVTRTCVVRSLTWRSAVMRRPYSVVSTSIRGRGNSRST
jgi:hypothetical protein